MNLPKKKATHCLCDMRISEKIFNSLSDLSIEVIRVPVCGSLAVPVSCHPDMQVFDCENGSLIISPNADKSLFDSLNSAGFNTVPGKAAAKGGYPFDRPYNACLLVKTLFCNERYTAKEILECADRVINVRQGYAKCSILPVTETAFITQDSGIYEAGKKQGFDVLLISPSEIGLNGYGNGFIGGCGGKISENDLVFFGNPSRLKIFPEILSFIENYKISCIFLSDEELYDFGSIISLCSET